MNDPTSDLERIHALLLSADQDNIGDVLLQVLAVRSRISNPLARMTAEPMLASLRRMAAKADLGWRVFATPPLLPRPLDDVEVLQLVSLEWALHELCYACESVELSAATTWGGSTPTRFYLNSIYHYVSSMFLLDTSSPRQKDLPIGGTAIRALHPMGLAALVDPVARILSQPLTPHITLGDTILRLRHSYLVHGDFSPRRIEYLIAQSEMRDPAQNELFATLIWDLFHELILFRLRIMALMTHEGIRVEPAILRYLASVSALPKSSGAS
jgi:hypothetical protein